MKRNKSIDQKNIKDVFQKEQCFAFHEAGHATAIYLNNRAKGMPTLYFLISFNRLSAESDDSPAQPDDYNYIVDVEGGRLIESLPVSFKSLEHELTENNELYPSHLQLFSDYLVAFELDIINLLAGPIAEAKYVAENDGEMINHRLVNVKALKNYGGDFDLALIDEYLQSYSDNEQERAEKLGELFRMAFSFVNDYHNWRAITKVADYILKTDNDTVSYHEVAETIGCRSIIEI
ncbi:MAG: hypothetical protein ACU83O_00890, partial [Gammaproteobacteria bacterium]